jgi:hypothetical protein
VDKVRRVEEGDDADPALHEGQGPPDQVAHRGRHLPGRHRPHLSVGGGRQRDPLRRDRAEDGQRRPHRQVGGVTRTRLR